MTDVEMEQRCKHYNTTLTNCECPGFTFRKYCKHTTYLKEKDNLNIKEVIVKMGDIKDGEDSLNVIERIGEETFNQLIRRGEFYEQHGRVYLLK